MRALTSEITGKFQARLQRNLKLTVRKVTGEDNPSMKEIEDSQVSFIHSVLVFCEMCPLSFAGAGRDTGEMGRVDETPRCSELYQAPATDDNRRGAHAADEQRAYFGSDCCEDSHRGRSSASLALCT